MKILAHRSWHFYVKMPNYTLLDSFVLPSGEAKWDCETRMSLDHIYILDRDHLFMNSYYRLLVRVLEYNKVISGISAGQMKIL